MASEQGIPASVEQTTEACADQGDSNERMAQVLRLCSTWVKTLKKEDLKKYLKKYNQDTDGNVETLRHRLLEYFSGGQEIPTEGSTLGDADTETEVREELTEEERISIPTPHESRSGPPRENRPQQDESMNWSCRMQQFPINRPREEEDEQFSREIPSQFQPHDHQRRIHWQDRRPMNYRYSASEAAVPTNYRNIPGPLSTGTDPRNIMKEVRRWGLKFNGQTDPVSFLERLEELLIYEDIPRDYLMLVLPELLQGSALAWYRNNKRFWRDWEDFLRDFKQFFLPRNYEFHLEEQIASRKQRQSEKGRDYVLEMQTLIRRHGGLADGTALRRIYHNLLPEYRQYIRSSDFLTVGELMNKIGEYETLAKELQQSRSRNIEYQPQMSRSNLENRNTGTVNRDNSRRTENSSTFQNRQQGPAEANWRRNPPECWNCGKIGHTRNFCRSPRNIFCSRCQRPGVTSRDCPCATPEN